MTRPKAPPMSVDVEQRATCTVRVGRSMMISLLRASGVDVPPEKDADIKVTFHTPGGADWSNEDIDLDESEQILTVTWTEVARLRRVGK